MGTCPKSYGCKRRAIPWPCTPVPDPDSFIYLFYLLIILAVLGAGCCPGAFSGCCEWALLSCPGHRLLTASFRVAEHGLLWWRHGLTCSAACGVILTKGGTLFLCPGRQILNHWTTREVPRIPTLNHYVRLLLYWWLKAMKNYWVVTI